MRVIFMGTPDFSVAVLKALIAKHEVVCVYTQPPRPAGRGHKLVASPIQVEAEKNGIIVRCPKTLKKEKEQKQFKELNADVAIVCAYGLILPQPILDGCPKGCINVHASLLPRWRGAAPIQRAIMAGDKQSGVTIMQMDAGLDTGDMLLSETVEITENMNAGELHDKLSVLGAKLILKTLDEMPTPRPQPLTGDTYAYKITKEECLINWNKSAEELHNFIRGLAPYPKAYFNYKNEQIKVLASKVVSGVNSSEKVGTLLDDELTVVCGQGTLLRLEMLQRAGKNPQARADFLRGFKIEKGENL